MARIDFGGTKEEVVTRKEFPMSRARKVLKGETIAVIGYGVQGPAQALNMKDNGFNVIIGQSKQYPKDWDRALHAKLLNRLTADNARAVIFDIWLTDPGNTNANAELARAIKANGKVVLAAALDTDIRPGISSLTLLKPLKPFAVASGHPLPSLQKRLNSL